MNKIASICIGLALIGQGAAQSVRIVTTTQDLASIASAVGGKRASVTSLIMGARDPHKLDAKPSYMSRVANADLFIAVGMDLEVGYEQPILEGSRNSKVQRGRPGHFYASSVVPVLERPTGQVHRGMGDVHPEGNPHVWLDPYNGRLIANAITERLSQINSAGAAEYRANAAAFIRRIDVAMFGQALVTKHGGERLWTWQRQNTLAQNLGIDLQGLGGWAGTMAPFNGAPIITYHKSWSYFVHRFGLRVVGELEPKPGIDPTPGHIMSLTKIANDNKVKAIVQEPFYSRKDANFLAQRTGASVVVVPNSVGQEKAASDYIALFDVIVSRLASALRG